MKALLFIGLFSSVTLVHARQKKAVEFSLSLNSVDPILELGNIHFAESKPLSGGDYTNKSIALGITGKYFIRENTALRLRIIHTSRNIRDHGEITSGNQFVSHELKFRQKLFRIAPGFQYSIPVKKFSFFGGVELPLTIHGRMTQYDNRYEESAAVNYTFTGNITDKIPGGTSFGLGLFTGANLYIIKKLAIGFEFGTAYEYTSVGGTLEKHVVYYGSSGNSDYYQYQEETIKQLKFAGFQAAINIIVKLR